MWGMQLGHQHAPLHHFRTAPDIGSLPFLPYCLGMSSTFRWIVLIQSSLILLWITLALI